MSSQFSPGEISSIIIAWLVLSVAITYRNFVGLFTGMGSIEVVIAGFIATATGFIIHEMGHKYVAIRRGYVAHFRLWMQGLLLTLFVVVFSGGGIVFGAPGAVYIHVASTTVRRLQDIPEEHSGRTRTSTSPLGNVPLSLHWHLMDY